MSQAVDASAVLAYLHQEPGWEVVRSLDGEVVLDLLSLYRRWENLYPAVDEGIRIRTKRDQNAV